MSCKRCACLCLICAILTSANGAVGLENFRKNQTPDSFATNPNPERLPEIIPQYPSSKSYLLEIDSKASRNTRFSRSTNDKNKILPSKYPSQSLPETSPKSPKNSSESHSNCKSLDNNIVFVDIATVWLVPMVGAFTPYFLKKSAALISWINCVGAGILLGTCFFHYMPEVQEEFTKLPNYDKHDLYFELYTVSGFLLILLVEQFVSSYCAHYFERDGLKSHCDHQVLDNEKKSDHSLQDGSHEKFLGSPTKSPHCHENSSSHSAIRSLAFVASLAVHSIVEGAALVLRAENWTKNSAMLISMLVHKFAVGLTMGFTLKTSKLSDKIAKIALFSWTIFSPMGGLLALLGCSTEMFSNSMIPPLNAIGLGSFLYVLFFEIAPHEFLGMEEVKGSASKPNKFVKALVVVAGVGLTLGMNKMLPHGCGNH